MDENNINSSEKYGIDIEIDDKSYLNSIDEIKDANKQLTDQLDLTASAIESNNKQYEKAKKDIDRLIGTIDKYTKNVELMPKALKEYKDINNAISKKSIKEMLGIDGSTDKLINNTKKSIDDLNPKLSEYSKRTSSIVNAISKYNKLVSDENAVPLAKALGIDDDELVEVIKKTTEGLAPLGKSIEEYAKYTKSIKNSITSYKSTVDSMEIKQLDEILGISDDSIMEVIKNTQELLGPLSNSLEKYAKSINTIANAISKYKNSTKKLSNKPINQVLGIGEKSVESVKRAGEALKPLSDNMSKFASATRSIVGSTSQFEDILKNFTEAMSGINTDELNLDTSKLIKGDVASAEQLKEQEEIAKKANNIFMDLKNMPKIPLANILGIDESTLELIDKAKQSLGELNTVLKTCATNLKQIANATAKYQQSAEKLSGKTVLDLLGIKSEYGDVINNISDYLNMFNNEIKKYKTASKTRKSINKSDSATLVNTEDADIMSRAINTLSNLIIDYTGKGLKGIGKKLIQSSNVRDMIYMLGTAYKDIKLFTSTVETLKNPDLVNKSDKEDIKESIIKGFVNKKTGSIISKVGESAGTTGVAGAAGVAATKASQAATLKLLAKLGLAGAIIAAVTASLALLYKGGKKASETTLQLSKQIIQFGSSLNEVSNKAIQASNKADAIKNRFSSLGDSMLSLLEPVYNGFIDLLDKFTAGVGSIREYEKAVGDLDSELLKAARAFSEGQSNVPIKQSLSAMRSTASYAQQSGFSNASAQNLAIGTFNLADMLALRYGEVANVSNIADQLTKAIMSGSDAAKDFGIVLNDEVLYGWLAMEKDIDAVNVKLSDAAMQAYRYELAMYEVGQQGSNTLQNQIKQWKQYGMQIQATQGQLLGFEKVVTLSGLDTTIPEIDKPIIGSTEGVDKTGPIVFGSGDITPTSPLPGTLPSEFNIPVNLTSGEQVELDVPENVNVKVAFPGLQESLNKLYEANSLIDTINAKQPVKVNVETNVETNTEESEVSVTRLIELYKSLPTGIKVLVNTLFPGIGLLASGAQLLEWFTKNTDIGINLKVFGTDLIQKASNLLLDIIYKINDIGNTKLFQTLGNFFTSKKTQRAVAFGSTAVLAGAAGAGAAVSSGLIGSGATAGTAAKKAMDMSRIIGFEALDKEVGKILYSVPKLADGGISTKHHLTSISENNKREAIIPLDSGSAQPAYQEIGREIASQLSGLSGNNTSVKVDLNVGVLTGDKNAARQLAIQLENEIARLQAQRGRLNYGIR